jgi:hypothetical protein
MLASKAGAYQSEALRLCSLPYPGNTKGGSITVPLTSCLTGLDSSVLQIKTKIVSCHTADSKPVKQEVNSTVILPPLTVFPALPINIRLGRKGLPRANTLVYSVYPEVTKKIMCCEYGPDSYIWSHCYRKCCP